MKTIDLIRTMAADPLVPGSPRTSLKLHLVPSSEAALRVVRVVLGFSADLLGSLLTPQSIFHTVVTSGAGFGAGRLALVLSWPAGRDHARLLPLAVFRVVALGLLSLAFDITSVGVCQIVTVGKTTVTSLATIPMLSILPVASLLAMLLRGATTARALQVRACSNQASAVCAQRLGMLFPPSCKARSSCAPGLHLA